MDRPDWAKAGRENKRKATAKIQRTDMLRSAWLPPRYPKANI
jgi:hypothetical protein